MAIPIDMSGKTVLVTGAGRGIGKEVALAFAKSGAKVYIGNRKENEGLETVNEIISMGGTAGFSKCDVTNKDDVRKLVDDAAAFGNGVLDCIVNCAGAASTHDRIDISDEEYRKVVDVNLLGTIHVIKCGFDHMFPRRSGNIILFSSVAGRLNGGMMPTYCASKAAVINYMQGAARLAGPYNVRVNCIAPGNVHTKMWDQIIDGKTNGFSGDLPDDALTREERETMFNENGKKVPLGHAQTAWDDAVATVFLASDLARNVTGQTLTIDGGYTMV